MIHLAARRAHHQRPGQRCAASITSSAGPRSESETEFCSTVILGAKVLAPGPHSGPSRGDPCRSSIRPMRHPRPRSAMSGSRRLQPACFAQIAVISEGTSPPTSRPDIIGRAPQRQSELAAKAPRRRRTNAVRDKPQYVRELARQAHSRARACVPTAMRVRSACRGRGRWPSTSGSRVGAFAITTWQIPCIRPASGAQPPSPRPCPHPAIAQGRFELEGQRRSGQCQRASSWSRPKRRRPSRTWSTSWKDRATILCMSREASTITSNSRKRMVHEAHRTE